MFYHVDRMLDAVYNDHDRVYCFMCSLDRLDYHYSSMFHMIMDRAGGGGRFQPAMRTRQRYTQDKMPVHHRDHECINNHTLWENQRCSSAQMHIIGTTWGRTQNKILPQLELFRCMVQTMKVTNIVSNNAFGKHS